MEDWILSQIIVRDVLSGNIYYYMIVLTTLPPVTLNRMITIIGCLFLPHFLAENSEDLPLSPPFPVAFSAL